MASVAVKLLAMLAVAAAAHALDVRWAELGPLAGGRKARVTLADGSRVTGKVAGVTPEGIRMVTAKQETLVPRAQVRQVRISRTTRHWRPIGTLIGLGAGLPGAVVLNTYLSNEGAGTPLTALVAVVPAGIGYLVGWSLDRKSTDVRIVPEP